MKKQFLILLGVAGMVVLLAGCGSQSAAPSSSAAPSGEESRPSDGKLIYKNYCLTCHGGNLQGGRGPNLQKVGERLDQSMIAEKVRKGGGGMPNFKVSLKEEDIQAVAAWLADFK